MTQEVLLHNQDHNIIGRALVDDVDSEQVFRHSWCLMKNGYAASRIGGQLVYLHRMIMNPVKGMQVDHINRDKLDCRRGNMRIVTDAQNKQNLPGRNRTSKYRGVHWDTQYSRWMARYGTGQNRHRKRFKTEQEAHEHIRQWRLEHLPFSQED